MSSPLFGRANTNEDVEEDVCMKIKEDEEKRGRDTCPRIHLTADYQLDFLARIRRSHHLPRNGAGDLYLSDQSGYRNGR